MRLDRHGLRLDLPGGWDGRIYRRSVGRGHTSSILHAGNFALPGDRGDYGSGAVERMQARHVFVALIEHDRSAAGLGLFARQGFPAPLRPSDFSRHVLQRTLPGQSGVQRFFSLEGRAFCLYVVLGSHAARGRLVPMVNTMLATARVGTLA
jgi:hypothetical protein